MNIHTKQAFLSLNRPVIAGLIAGAIILGVASPVMAIGDVSGFCPLNLAEIEKNASKPAKKINVIITAYSSTPDQTDDTPFITASGKKVADGIVANNLLPFGSKIRIPELYGNKVFIVEDRMHKRKGNYHVDIWFPEYIQAKNFGAKLTYIEVLEN